MDYQLLEQHRCFHGRQEVYSHWSNATQSTMRFAIYLPIAAATQPCPVVFWLSGLTCSEQNFITKAGAQRVAAELGIIIVAPDTSPRGIQLPADAAEDFGEGASFYLNATVAPWDKHYQMYDYISRELPHFIAAHFPINPQQMGIFGHSMGGHGALMIGLKNAHTFRSLSALAPICALTQCTWGIKACTGFLGTHKKDWQEYDACALMRTMPWPHGVIRIDQGLADPYLSELKPELLKQACQEVNVPLQLNLHDEFQHDYYFVASFIEQHLRIHAQQLMNQ